MQVIIDKGSRNITYKNVAKVDDQGEELVLQSTDSGYIEITLNEWLLAKAHSCIIEKRCLICVDGVFLDFREDGV